MKKDRTIYLFSPEKNFLLKQEREISFEEIIAAIDNDQLLAVIEHPNQGKYKNQKMYIIYAKEYVYLVPFLEEENGNIFLKTIILSRKAKQKYFGKKEYEK